MMLVRRSVAQFRPLVTDREGGDSERGGGESPTPLTMSTVIFALIMGKMLIL